MNKKKLIILLSLMVLVIILLVIVLMNPKNNELSLEKQGQSQEQDSLNVSKNKALLDESQELIVGQDVILIESEAPRQEILDNSGQPLKNVDLSVSKDGFSPKEFKVNAGQVVTIKLIVKDDNNHAFNFSDINLLASDILVTKGYALEFNIVAPLESGTFKFYNVNFPENTGKMIVE